MSASLTARLSARAADGWTAVIDGLRAFGRRHPALRQALRPLARGLRARVPFGLMQTTPERYQDWIAAYDTLTEADRAAIRARVAAMADPPLISVVMPVYNPPEAFFRAAIASVRAQLYPHWELCVADDASTAPHVAAVLAEAAAADPRIRFVRRAANGHISAATNSALDLARGAWVALMDHDDLLAEQALFEVAVEIAAHPDADLIYSDEDKIDANGVRSEPNFKGDFDPDLLLGQNFVSHLGVYRRTLIARLGGLRVGFEGSQDHDLALRVAAESGAIRHIPAILYHWRQDSGQASFSEAAMAKCIDAARRAVSDHLAARAPDATLRPAPLAGLFTRVVWPLPDPPPSLSVILTPRGPLAPVLEGLLTRTDYPLDVLIRGRNVTIPDRFANDPRVRLINGPIEASAQGEVLLFFDGALGILDPYWAREMVSHAIRPDVGAVGARLLSVNRTIDQAGIVLGIDGWAGSPPRRSGRNDPGPFGLLTLARGVTAVSGACLAVRRDVYLSAGGFDPDPAPVAAGIALCLTLRDKGLRTVWTPFAELIWTADPAPEAAPADWREARDPFWNPNLAQVSGRRVLAFPPGRVPPWRV